LYAACVAASPPSSRPGRGYTFGVTKSLTDEELAALQREIENLKLEHRDLDDIINRLASQAGQDQLQLQRLKKRKLHLKDLISQLEAQTVPDISA
jgi:hypothetical protein